MSEFIIAEGITRDLNRQFGAGLVPHETVLGALENKTLVAFMKLKKEMILQARQNAISPESLTEVARVTGASKDIEIARASIRRIYEKTTLTQASISYILERTIFLSSVTGDPTDVEWGYQMVSDFGEVEDRNLVSIVSAFANLGCLGCIEYARDKAKLIKDNERQIMSFISIINNLGDDSIIRSRTVRAVRGKTKKLDDTCLRAKYSALVAGVRPNLDNITNIWNVSKDINLGSERDEVLFHLVEALLKIKGKDARHFMRSVFKEIEGPYYQAKASVAVIRNDRSLVVTIEGLCGLLGEINSKSHRDETTLSVIETLVEIYPTREAIQIINSISDIEIRDKAFTIIVSALIERNDIATARVQVNKIREIWLKAKFLGIIAVYDRDIKGLRSARETLTMGNSVTASQRAAGLMGIVEAMINAICRSII